MVRSSGFRVRRPDRPRARPRAEGNRAEIPPIQLHDKVTIGSAAPGDWAPSMDSVNIG
jgi:hypothetical protein